MNMRPTHNWNILIDIIYIFTKIVSHYYIFVIMAQAPLPPAAHPSSDASVERAARKRVPPMLLCDILRDYQ